MSRNPRIWQALIMALTILSWALGAALVFGQGGSGRAPQNGAGRGDANKVKTPPANRTAPPRKRTPAPQQSPCSAQSPTQGTGRARTATLGRGVTLEMVEIPSGSFCMGVTLGGINDAEPVHRVTIRDGVYMGKYEVTQAQWQAVMGTNPSYHKDCGGNCPVEQVWWDAAQKFIQSLNQINDGFIYRLPTEAEWEYACCAGTTGDYAGYLDEMAWYGANSGDRTHSVGTKQPNAFGLYDMHGNVTEWCQDYYHFRYTGAPNDGSAWLSGGEQKYRVLRGGGWDPHVLYPRSALRNRAGTGDSGLGFRVVAVARTQ